MGTESSGILTPGSNILRLCRLRGSIRPEARENCGHELSCSSKFGTHKDLTQITQQRGSAMDGVAAIDGNEWYVDGLAFECTRCGNCCTGSPGHVWVSLPEVERLASRLSLTIDQFGSRYLRLVGSRLSLLESRRGDCVFWDAASGCTVYDARPDQCRSWPFWHSHLADPESWQKVSEFCPGCNSGPSYDLVQIRSILQLSPDRPGWPDRTDSD
jgi:Fe-S-cluster containining protein